MICKAFYIEPLSWYRKVAIYIIFILVLLLSQLYYGGGILNSVLYVRYKNNDDYQYIVNAGQ